MNKKKTKRFAVAYIKDKYDNLFMGKRNDSGKWTQSAGGLYANEDPFVGMLRELKEETGLDGTIVKLLKIGKKSKDSIIYLFEVQINPEQRIDPSKDPDDECKIWEYKDPIDIVDNLHVPLIENWAIQYWRDN